MASFYRYLGENRGPCPGMQVEVQVETVSTDAEYASCKVELRTKKKSPSPIHKHTNLQWNQAYLTLDD